MVTLMPQMARLKGNELQMGSMDVGPISDQTGQQGRYENESVVEEAIMHCMI